MRRSTIYIFILLLLSSFFVNQNSVAKVLISKIKVGGTVTSTDEFVELYNYSSSSASLEGWSLKKRTSSGSEYSLISDFRSSTINPFAYFLVAHRDYTETTTPDLFYSNNSYSIANNNGLILLDPFQVIVDEVYWGTISSTTGTPFANPSAGTSLVRLPNDDSGNFFDTDDSSFDFTQLMEAPFSSYSPPRPYFEFISSTPNPTSTESTEDNNGTGFGFDSELWKFVKINEIMPNPNSGEEWIELYNSTSTDVILDGGTICDDRIDTCTIATLSGTILSNNLFTVFLSGSKLNNDGDSVFLKNPSGEIIDSFTYTDNLLPKKGQSVARVVDGGDTDLNTDWAVTETPTEGATNTITIPPVPISGGGGGGGSGGIWVPDNNTRTNPTSTPKKTSLPKQELVTIFWNLQPPSLTRVNTSTFFDAHLSADPRGGKISFLWNFGDGQTAEGEKVAHTYATSGIFTVEINATSSQSTTGTTKFLLKVVAENSFDEKVYLSEISPLPEKGEDEYIALSSRADASTFIGGWKIGVGNDRWFTIPTSTSISPNEKLVFFKTATKLPLNNEEGVAYLSTPDGKIVDLVYYSAGKTGQKYILNDKIWEWQPKPENQPKKVEDIKIASTNKKIIYYKNVSTAEAQDLSPDDYVRVRGIVESLPGIPGTNYFYIRDDRGGMQIYSYKKDFPALTLGDTVEVIGQIGVYQGSNRIKTKSAANIKKIAAGEAPIPEEKSISEIDENDFGTLVSLQGEITELKSNYLYLDDGLSEVVVSLPQKANIDHKELHEGDTVKITGIIEKTTNGMRIVPRTASDVSFIRGFSSSNNEAQNPNTNKYFLISALGLILLGSGFIIKKFIILK